MSHKERLLVIMDEQVAIVMQSGKLRRQLTFLIFLPQQSIESR